MFETKTQTAIMLTLIVVVIVVLFFMWYQSWMAPRCLDYGYVQATSAYDRYGQSICSKVIDGTQQLIPLETLIERNQRR